VVGAGAGGSSSPASIGAITNSLCAGNTVSGVSLSGGGVVGAGSTGSSAQIGADSDSPAISNSLFTGNKVSSGNLDGGGVVGAGSISSSAKIGADSNSPAISNSLFTGNEVMVDSGNLRGGGVVGAGSEGSTASIGAITDSLFTGNRVTVKGSIIGGGVVGSISLGTTASLGDISGSFFTDNIISAGALLGGLIYTADDLTIENSVFTGNEFTVSNSNLFLGTVSIDTGKAGTGGDTDKAIHTVTLKASGGQTTLFQNNLVNDNSTNSNSIAFRNLLGSDSISSAELKIDTGNAEDEGGAGTVALVDPIWVNLNSGKTFAMTVSGEGNFLWGGENTVTSEGAVADNTINLGSGSDAPVITLLA
jgi:hypothetical protein